MQKAMDAVKDVISKKQSSAIFKVSLYNGYYNK